MRVASARRNTLFFPMMLCATVAAAMMLAGCRALPVQYSPATFRTQADIESSATAFWKASSLPDICKDAAREQAAQARKAEPLGEGSVAVGAPQPPKIAIVEFTVEYVTTKLETPFKQQAVAGATEFGYIGLPVTVIGLGRKRVIYNHDLKTYLPNEFYNIFVGEMENAGYAILPADIVKRAGAYGDFVAVAPGSAKPLEFLNVVGSDTGRSKNVEYWPAQGLSTIVGAQRGSVDKIERQILAQTGADAALRVRVRVGVWYGYASIERETRIEVVTLSHAGKITAKRSLVSQQIVIDKSKFKVFQGVVYPVKTNLYTEQMAQIFAAYAKMAVEMLRCKPPQMAVK
jgi:hypothetical protein